MTKACPAINKIRGVLEVRSQSWVLRIVYNIHGDQFRSVYTHYFKKSYVIKIIIFYIIIIAKEHFYGEHLFS